MEKTQSILKENSSEINTSSNIAHREYRLLESVIKNITVISKDQCNQDSDSIDSILVQEIEKARKEVRRLFPHIDFDNKDSVENAKSSLTFHSNELNDSNLFIHLSGSLIENCHHEDTDYIILNIDGDIVNIYYNDETFFQRTNFNEEETLHIIARKFDKAAYALVICDSLFYNMFSMFEDIEFKYFAIKDFISLSSSQQQSIIDQFKGEKYEPIKSKENPKNSTFDFLKFKYTICKNTYSQQQQREIEDLFEQRSNIKKKPDRKLQYVLNISPYAPVRKNASYTEIIQALDSRLYKMDKVKERIAECMIASKYSSTRGLRLLIVGNPGTGKTTIAQVIAALYGIPFEIISLNGVSSALDLKGTDPSYDGSDVGKFVRSFYTHGTSEMVLVLDEIDKLGFNDKDGNPADSMLDTLSDVNLCYDQFIEMAIDTRNTVYIATANSLQNVPDYLVNRFEVIRIDDYDFEDKVNIAKQFIIPKLLTSYGISKEDVIFNDESIYEIARSYCDDEGARKIKDNLNTIIRKILCIWDSNGEKKCIKVDSDFVKSSLDVYTNNSDPKIRFNRNRSNYSKPIYNEILLTLDILRNHKLDSQLRESNSKRLEYLTSLIQGSKHFTEFDIDDFCVAINKTHYGLFSVKEALAKRFYTKALRKESFSGEKFLLVGGPGIGKSSICESIASALKMPYARVSLNGVSDVKTLKGFDRTYLGSDAGLIVKGLAQVKSTRVVLHLDEIDKMGHKDGMDGSYILNDVLDNESKLMDIFLGVPVDLSEIIFIATANNLSDVHPLLLDRFTVIHLDGYSINDKDQIVTNYILPKFQRLHNDTGLTFSFTPEAKKLLLSGYCTSFGVRDIEKAVEQIITDKIYRNKDHLNTLNYVIDSKDVQLSLGAKPITRGNMPKKTKPGLSKALAVTSDNHGLVFAIETLVIPGDSTTQITGLPRESSIDSVKIAKSYIKCHYEDRLKNNGIHLHFGEGAVIKDGPSAGVAIIVSLASAIYNVSVVGDYAYTGEIDLFGNVFSIGGVNEKIQAAEKSGCSCVLIPYDNYKQLTPKDLNKFSIKIVPVSHVSEVLNLALPDIQVWEKEQHDPNETVSRHTSINN